MYICVICTLIMLIGVCVLMCVCVCTHVHELEHECILDGHV